jgi:S1-C subfamily serine protease
MLDPSTRGRGLTVEEEEHLDRACDAFEAAWKAGRRPAIEEHLREAPEGAREALLVELLRIELAYRRRDGEEPAPEEYRARLPGDAAMIDAVFAEAAPAAVLPGGAAAGDTTAEPSLSPEAGSGVGPCVVVPGYEVQGLLGRGGMGVVYRARQISLNRTVALKMILNAEHASDADRHRFRAEAEAIARLQHPHIVQIHEVGEHNGLPYFSLECCAGGSLADRLDGTPWEASKAAALVETLARAVHAAHRKGVVHRDLKPGNVLVTEDGTLKVTDFGLAKKLDAAGHSTSGVVMGTPSYMAPEQASGKGKAVGPHTDVYALGAVLYELLTGRPPFKAATSLDTILQVISEAPPPPTRLNPRVPRDLEAVCLKCLQKDPKKRYASAADLADDLQRYQKGESTRVRPPGRLERLGHRLRRRKELLYVAAGALVAVGMTWVVVALNPKPPNPQSPGAIPMTPPGTGKPIETQPVEAVRLDVAAMDKVKRATVYLRVVRADGSRSAGTGFFGAPEARNIILTNAHVVGMLSPYSRRPRSIEVFINSGEPDEKRLTARVLGVDRVSDLTVLETNTQDGMPEPLTVRSAGGLREQTKVYTFGFTLDERLGKTITVRSTSVSALYREMRIGQLGQLKVEVAGGMDPGTSGGPVVDVNGQVIGVAVAGIEGWLINFAIPGDRVHAILNGGLASLDIGQAYVEGGREGIPVLVWMIDPRHRIREVSLDVWAGFPPRRSKPTRPPADSTPAAEPGDSQRLRAKLPYRQGEARCDVLLPKLPPGKKYWVQPNWVDTSGKRRWATASVYQMDDSPPVERKPVNLTHRFPDGANHPLTLTSTNIFKLSNDEDEYNAPAKMVTRVKFREHVSANNAGAALRLEYIDINRELIIDGVRRQSQLLASVEDDLLKLQVLLQMDAQGNVTANQLDLNTLGLITRGPNGRQKQSAIIKFHEPVKHGLDALSVPLPGREVKPLESWKARRPLPVNTPNRYELGTLDLTYTYLGVRKNTVGREEAVIAIDGLVLGAEGKEAQFGGRASGEAVVDLTTGQITKTRTKVTMDLEVPIELDAAPSGDEIGSKPGETIRVIAVLDSVLERKL